MLKHSPEVCRYGKTKPKNAPSEEGWTIEDEQCQKIGPEGIRQ